MPVDGWFARPGGGLTGWLSRSGHQLRYHVQRHGEGRKYWEAHYPDGTHTDNHRTMEEAKRACENWEPDPTLVPLVEQTTEVDDSASAGDATPFRAVIAAHLWDTRPPINRTVKAEALKNLITLAQMRATVETLIQEQIAIARTAKRLHWGGWAYGAEPRTWSEIGGALGVSKQAAAKRYGDNTH